MNTLEEVMLIKPLIIDKVPHLITTSDVAVGFWTLLSKIITLIDRDRDITMLLDKRLKNLLVLQEAR